LAEDWQTYRFAAAGELVTGDIETIPALSLFLKLGPAFYLAVKIGFPGFT